MKQQALKSILIGGLTVTETAEGNTVTLGIKGKSVILTKGDFNKLHDAVDELFCKDTIIKCAVCGDEIAACSELSEKLAIVTVEPCQTCAKKEAVTYENP